MTFIGRNDEIQAFKHWMNNATAPWILYIYDAIEEAEKKGGIGKTWLLRRYVEYVRNEYPDIAVVTADFFNIDDRDGLLLAEKAIAGLQQLYPSWYPDAFYKALTLYRTEISQLHVESGWRDRITSIHQALSDSLDEDLERLDTYRQNEQKTLLFVFDTYEAIEQNPAIAVTRLAQKFPDNFWANHVRAIIAGRNRIDWSHVNWIGREQEVQEIALYPFKLQEMLEYVEETSVYDIKPQSEQAHLLYDLTEGRPIIIGLAVDVLNRHILTLDQLVEVTRPAFEGCLVAQINKLELPLNWIILFMAHVYHRFNFPLLEWILQIVKPEEMVSALDLEELLEDLPRLSFVRRSSSGDDFVLHDEMRRLVTKYCWGAQDAGTIWRKEISRLVIRYYEQQITQVSNEQQRQEYIIEMLYHRLYIDPEDGFRYFQNYVYNAIRLVKNAFARLLLQETQKFTPTLSVEQHHELLFAEAKLYRIENCSREALVLLDKLEHSDESWQAVHRADYLLESGLNYAQIGDWLKATECYTECLKMAKEKGQTLRIAHLYSHLGLLNRYKGRLNQALCYYNESLTIYKDGHYLLDYATVLANMSIIYCLQGQFEEALRRATIALRIRQSQFQEDKSSEALLGFSLNILGRIYLCVGNISNAEKYFTEAYHFFLRTNHKIGLAQVYNRFGQIHLLQAQLEQAKEFFEKAEKASLNVSAEQLVNSLNKQGNVCLLQQKWHEAIRFFRQAIVEADKANDRYQEVENFIDLSRAFWMQKEVSLAMSTLQRADEIASGESYFRFLGCIEQLKAEISLHIGEQIVAIRHLARYCHFMALYNNIEYEVAIRNTIHILLSIPKNSAISLLKELISYWKTII